MVEHTLAWLSNAGGSWSDMTRKRPTTWAWSNWRVPYSGTAASGNSSFEIVAKYYPMTMLARERNQTSEYRREKVRRQTIAEGTFASLDRLGWARTRLRGLWKVDCEGYTASFAHNVLKVVRRLLERTGTPGVFVPG